MDNPVFDFSKDFTIDQIQTIDDGLAALVQLDSELHEIESRIMKIETAGTLDQENLNRTHKAAWHRRQYKKLVQGRLGQLRRVEKAQRVSHAQDAGNGRRFEIKRSIDHQFVCIAKEELDQEDFDEMMSEANRRVRAAQEEMAGDQA